ncbi:MAG: DNA repair protein RecO [Haliea sp.]|jgi:DNA repair protein RecO (recombination protein O)|uniref:DNA repair protein RecO n=1 Tax=Haliea sp. TaxID=1932666 RepID=UPI000C502510|nr:DNA repair protein RecO [Haliea sp.]MBM70080.1 DNA repair protein RecO [Haliea sp.]|tara:strand:- start:103377 stop:104105 length:729 start_codon:yes stop_codon:yes gene_type:complete
MRVSLQPAYLLHSRPYRDSSLLLDMFTAEHGRVALIGRGAQRRSRGGSQASLLQPFRPLLVSFSGRAEQKPLLAVEPAGALPALRAERLFSGLYLNELLVRLLQRHDPQPELFALYGNTLGGLACNPSTEADLRRFEFGLLDALGYGFDPAHDGHSGLPVEPGRWYQYQAEFGLVACSDAVAAQGTRFAGADLLGIAAGQYDGEYSMAAKRLLRQALASHLGERPLHSRELFRQFRHAGRQQ